MPGFRRATVAEWSRCPRTRVSNSPWMRWILRLGRGRRSAALFCGMKCLFLQVLVSIDVRSKLRSLRNHHVFAAGQPEYRSSRTVCTGAFLVRPYRGLFVVAHTDKVNTQAQLAAVAHALLGLGLPHYAGGHCARGNHAQPVDVDFFQDFQFLDVADMRASG